MEFRYVHCCHGVMGYITKIVTFYYYIGDKNASIANWNYFLFIKLTPSYYTKILYRGRRKSFTELPYFSSSTNFNRLLRQVPAFVTYVSSFYRHAIVRITLFVILEYIKCLRILRFDNSNC